MKVCSFVDALDSKNGRVMMVKNVLNSMRCVMEQHTARINLMKTLYSARDGPVWLALKNVMTIILDVHNGVMGRQLV